MGGEALGPAGAAVAGPLEVPFGDRGARALGGGSLGLVPMPSRGGGRGMEAARPLPAGQLLLMEPCCLAYGAAGTRAGPAAAVRAVEAVAILPEGRPRRQALAGLAQLHPRALADLSPEALQTLRAEHTAEELDRLAGVLALPGGGDEALRLLAAARMNAFGCGWYFLTDMFNHSCRPNCWKFVQGAPAGESCVRTLRAVAPGEELTLDYLGDMHTADRASRRERLRQQFSFDCDCDLCLGTGELASLEAVAEGEAEALMLPGALEALRCFGDSAEAFFGGETGEGGGGGDRGVDGGLVTAAASGGGTSASSRVRTPPAECEALLVDALGLLLASRECLGPRHLLVARAQALAARACAELGGRAPGAGLKALAAETLGLPIPPGAGGEDGWLAGGGELAVLGVRLWALAELRETQVVLFGRGAAGGADDSHPRTADTLFELSEALGALHCQGPRNWEALGAVPALRALVPPSVTSAGAPGRLQAECHAAAAAIARLQGMDV